MYKNPEKYMAIDLAEIANKYYEEQNIPDCANCDVEKENAKLRASMDRQFKIGKILSDNNMKLKEQLVDVRPSEYQSVHDCDNCDVEDLRVNNESAELVITNARRIIGELEKEIAGLKLITAVCNYAIKPVELIAEGEISCDIFNGDFYIGDITSSELKDMLIKKEGKNIKIFIQEVSK